ncbi:sugar phosphate isomerase/epimerase family protein [Scatolibacter rhodanostii]|uniref:sugar phosphate isomerase/epimerase family protein n=1 Tax=Scatolibacter rhodanostii TaxID=2014781 RepID=UPI0013564CD3|nr:TIM barrel protein [Scatolibacter rhodanostii]
MNFSFCAFADEADSAISGQIQALTDNKIKFLEIRGVDGENIAAISKEKAKSVRAQLDLAGIKVWSMGSPTGKIKLTDDFSAHLDEFKHMCELAEILGASRFRLFSFYGADNSNAARDEVFERLNKICDTAKDFPLVLCHENEKDIWGEKAPECLKIHEKFSSIKAVFDPANFIQAGQNVLDAWEILHPYVDYLHIKDALADGTVVPAGKGIGCIPEILTRYRQDGGNVLTLEPHLSNFVGLSELESENKTEVSFSYPSQRAAFDAAVSALKEVISKLY